MCVKVISAQNRQLHYKIRQKFKKPVHWVIILTMAISDEKRRIPRIKNNAANILYDLRDNVNKLSVAFYISL